MLSQNVPLPGAIIQEKASIYAKELNIENFKASDCSLHRWRERRNITFKTISRIVNAWKETLLSTHLSKYELKKIYNVDEFGLFYKYGINKTYQLTSEKCTGKKLSKICITGMASANAVGGKMPMFIIGKSSKPRCFKKRQVFPLPIQK